MPQATAVSTFGGAKLVPLYDPEDALVLPVNLQPSKTYSKGTVLGLAGTAANDVQTLTISGTPTGGTFTIHGTNPITGAAFTTAAIAYNASAATTASAVQTAIGNGVTVAGTGGALPGTPVVLTFSGSAASMPVALMTTTDSLTGGTTPASSIAHTTTGRTAGSYDTYTGGGSTDPAKCILQYDCATDASGNVVIGGQTPDQLGLSGSKDAPAYFSGTFDTSELTGLDAGAVTDLNGRLLSGSVTSGILMFG